jgi:DNA repair exonuclease SbcCD ATPase subunit
VNKSIDYTSDEIRTIIEVQKQYRDKITSIDEQTSGILKEIKEIEIYLCENKEGSDLDPEDVLKSITLKEEEIKVLEKDLETHTSNLQKIEKYKQYQKDQQNYNSWIEKKKILEKQEQKDRLKYASSTLLLEKILEAESIAITNIITSINTHAQLYLDCFFPDNPISVKLLSFKESKKANIQSKPQINIGIEYKGMECDLTMLSGGELSRIVLAFTLALAEIFNIPIIMLDECTASLDQDLTSDVFEGIKENFKGKLVLVIAHQIIESYFDKVIKLSDK